MRILITGGAGFVGSRLALAFQENHRDAKITVLDNLKRRGSERNISELEAAGIEFRHGDIRCPEDLKSLPHNYDLFLEASAEPSVLAGLNESPEYLLQTNLVGTLNCLEFARARVKRTIFLSTSRVYSISALRNIQLQEKDSRFEIADGQKEPGVSAKGIAEIFSTNTARSLYGASKLASELFIQEYVFTYKMQAVINRCGVIAGAGQFGKVDQGVFTLWMAHHYFGKSLEYKGYGGSGKQVRDLLHPLDLYDLLISQTRQEPCWQGEVYNAGGSRAVSVSLREWTDLCAQVSGKKTEIKANQETSGVDIPLYLSDNSKAEESFAWRPKRNTATIAEDIFRWIQKNEAALRPVFRI